VGASIGIAVYPRDGEDADGLMRHADLALYQVKSGGRGHSRFYSEALDAATKKRHGMEHALRRALASGGLRIVYQPIYTAADLRIVGAEALLRWRDDEFGAVEPSEFISVAEESGLIVPLGAAVLRTACEQLAQWKHEGHALRMMVNLSAHQIDEERLHELVTRALWDSDLSPRDLELEVTESALMRDEQVAASTFRALKRIGVSISLDDFGTGFSSLSYLKRFPVDTVKIDRSFVRDLAFDGDDAAIVSAILSIARQLGLNVVAEGVETEEQRTYLTERMCSHLQGFLLCPPLPPDAFGELLRTGVVPGSPRGATRADPCGGPQGRVVCPLVPFSRIHPGARSLSGGPPMAREAVVVDSVRTGLTKAHRGSFNMTEPVDYTAHALREVVARHPNLDPVEIEDVNLGCGHPEGCMGMNMARIAAMAAGFPKEVVGTTVNRFCSSGSQAIAMAAHEIIQESADAAIGAGVETITMMQDGTQNTNRLVNAAARERFPGLYFPMGVTAEIVAERYKISREDQDRYSLQSQQRYAQAVKDGKIAEDIVPMKVTRRVMKKGEDPYEEEFTVDADECNRPDTTLEGLSSLKPVFKKEEEGGTVTAGNASQLSDGASATLLMSSERAKQLNIEPLAIYRGTAVAGCGPEEMGIGPVFAVPKLLKRHGLKIDDIGLIELNEAFASQLLYCQRELGIDNEVLNPLGGSISIGHPFGMTGSRMTGQLLREMKRRGVRYGIVTMCVGGGQGLASLFEAA